MKSLEELLYGELLVAIFFQPRIPIGEIEDVDRFPMNHVSKRLVDLLGASLLRLRKSDSEHHLHGFATFLGILVLTFHPLFEGITRLSILLPFQVKLLDDLRIIGFAHIDSILPTEDVDHEQVNGLVTNSRWINFCPHTILDTLRLPPAIADLLDYASLLLEDFHLTWVQDRVWELRAFKWTGIEFRSESFFEVFSCLFSSSQGV